MTKLVDLRNRGFSLLELMVATVLFTFIAGIVFSLLTSSQLQYNSEKDLMGAFQSANTAMDQIARDIHSAGYPPKNSFPAGSSAQSWALPFAWAQSSGYPNSPCAMPAGCNNVPGDFDLILEADLGNGVQWIRYSLQGTTLMRGVAPKNGGDPVTDTGNALIPYLENVMNNASSNRMDQIRASYPAMFPSDTPVPVFTYSYDKGSSLQPVTIREVNVCLIVQSPRLDPTTGQPRVLTLTGQALRFNPNK